VSAAPVVFVGNARCFHTMDWFRSAQVVCAPHPVVFATDLIESEGHRRLVNDRDEIINLLNIDRLLLPEQSHRGNVWRNLVKFAMLPVQAVLLRRLYRTMPQASYHAHTMYYMVLCQIAGVPFVGTPQGSEILIRPKRSALYRWFASRALRAADTVTVDSVAMASGVRELSGRDAVVVQNGIDLDAIQRQRDRQGTRSGVLSIRAIAANYRIEQLLAARARMADGPPITLVYPFWEVAALAGVRAGLRPGDRDLGRLDRSAMYAEMGRARLVVSVPVSDSSPRSVYEAVFSGACVAVTANPYLDALPACMRARIVVVDLTDPEWLPRALEQAEAMGSTPYEPSAAALDLFDQRRSMQRVAERYYRGFRAEGAAPAEGHP
jgi:glycosyl transferase family 4